MNFQDTVLAYMRAQFPAVEFSPGVETTRKGFDPETSCSITWPPNTPQTVQDALRKYLTFRQFASALELITRDLGVIVDNATLRIAQDADDGTVDHSYVVTDDTIAWKRRAN